MNTTAYKKTEYFFDIIRSGQEKGNTGVKNHAATPMANARGNEKKAGSE
jgi:hypothetical protein